MAAESSECEWLIWSVPRDGSSIVVPKGARFVKVLGPGSARFALDTDFAAIEALLISNVHLNIYGVNFDNVKVLAALDMSCAKASGCIPEKWIFPPNFPSLTHFVGDGCAPEMQSHCLATMFQYRRKESHALSHALSSTVVEAPYAFNMNISPEAPCRLVLPVTRRVRGLGASRVVLRGSEDGWHADVELEHSDTHVLGTNPQLFWQFEKEEKITVAMEQDAAKFNAEHANDMQRKCMATESVTWDQLGQVADLGWGSSDIASVSLNGVQVETEKKGFVLLKALFELSGHYLMNKVRRLGFDPCRDEEHPEAESAVKKKKRKAPRSSRCEYATNKNLTIEWTSQPLAAIRAGLALEFDKLVAQVCAQDSAHS